MLNFGRAIFLLSLADAENALEYSVEGYLERSSSKTFVNPKKENDAHKKPSSRSETPIRIPIPRCPFNGANFDISGPESGYLIEELPKIPPLTNDHRRISSRSKRPPLVYDKSQIITRRPDEAEEQNDSKFH